MKELAELAKPKIVPPLHHQFVPAVLANHAYLELVRDSGRAVPLVIGLERHEGHFSVYRTQCFGEGAGSLRTHPHVRAHASAAAHRA